MADDAKLCQQCGTAFSGTERQRFCNPCKRAKQAVFDRAAKARRSAKLAEQRRLNPTANCEDCGAVIELGRMSGAQRRLCPPCKRARKSARYYADAERLKARQSAYHRARRDEINAKRRDVYATDDVYRQKVKSWSNPQRNRERLKERRRSDPQWRLSQNIRAAIWRGLAAGQKRGRTFEVLGYSIDALRKHLEGQFKPGMSWDNYGEWHVDHVIPLSAFNYETTDDLDFGQAWSLKNLSPLWKQENQKKHARLIKPFQPSLLIAETSNGR